MTRFLKNLSASTRWRRRRARAATASLRAAQGRFDLSMCVLLKAALDHVDGGHLASLALRATLDRLAGARP